MNTSYLDGISRRWSTDGGMGNERSADDYTDAGCRVLAEHAFADIPPLVSLVRELQASIPARVVLDGDPEVIEAALGALPDRAVVTSESLTSFDMFLKQTMVSTRRSAWYQAGVSKPFDSGFLARNYAPLVVLR